MKFIFPQNYNFKNKFLGTFEYSTLLFNIIWDIFILLIINILFKNLSLKIFCFIVFCFPLLLLSFSGLNGENMVYAFFYILKFQIKNKLYLYKKSNNP